jgi:glycosyltransferase involved in cell wall biosynthesis
VPEISIIIPTRNRSGLLALSLLSAQRQRHVDLEVIVVDDGSADDTPGMLRRLAPPVRVIRHDRAQGVSAARNHGIAEAQGEWVAFLDDDDLWAPEKLALQLEALRRDGTHWAYAGAVDIAPNHSVIAGRPPFPPDRIVAELPSQNLLPAGASNVIVRKAWLPGPTVFDGRLYHSADWDLWIRLASQGPPSCVARPLVAYRFHAGGASLDLLGMLSEVDEIERRYGSQVNRSDYHRYLAKLAKRAGWRRKELQHYWRAATANGSDYALKDLLSDTWTVAMGGLASRLGRPKMGRHVRSTDDPYAAWKNEAQAWVDGVVHQHVAARA